MYGGCDAGSKRFNAVESTWGSGAKRSKVVSSICGNDVDVASKGAWRLGLAKGIGLNLIRQIPGILRRTTFSKLESLDRFLKLLSASTRFFRIFFTFWKLYPL